QSVTPAALRQAPGRTYTYWINGDSIVVHGFSAINQDTLGGEKESMVTHLAVLDWLIKVLPDSLNLTQYLDNDTVYQTLTIIDDTLYISNGNQVSLTNYL